ncbi:DegT/DnrJ/EryC1/StrS family aminotransferase [Pelobacter propionicus]|uniref:DegT/DnrJ/EryC1/StrS aminotransferase n=1 Tax=Pelobacter propionicus (strain DSM 2379 / NBRC 103807 / OttBd1) TaxID=338966 RepID=A1AT01_PELPD|nr:DegT/DnrJ/EryC1/StrS aminotransferase [Pelobacter propionicus DSM 2379]
MVNVPFIDLHAQYESIRGEITDAVQEVLDSSAFVGGPFVEKFEESFARFCGTAHAVAVSSGTSALWMTLICLGIGPGDEVITVPNTFIATAEAISLCGARPVFVDVEQDSCTLDPGLLQAAVTPNTKAIIPVHLFGQPANMDPIMAFAAERNLFVIEDACQAHGARYRDRPVGSMGDAACFSFYPGKNLGAYGEAGAVTTNNAELAGNIRRMRDHGQSRKYYHGMIGWNGRMDGIQGAVLSVKLEYLASWNEKRRKNAALYNDFLHVHEGVILPVEMEYARHIYHIYAIRVQNRDRVLARLNEKGINCGIHYPLPIHLQDAYRSFGLAKGTFPVTEQVADQLLSLPMYPELTHEQIEYVARETKNVTMASR